MRRMRAVLAATLTMAIVGAVAGAGSAGAATTGAGTSKASTSVLQVALGNNGSLLNLRLLGDDSQSTIDPKVSTPAAFTRLSPLTISSAVQALNISLPTVEAKAPGGSSPVSSQAVDLSTPASSGKVSAATLSATAAADAAKSGLNSSVDGIALVGGLLGLKSASSNLGTDALTAASDGTRGVKLDTLTVLDLGALLKLLGIDLANLPVSTVSGLLSKLQLPVAGLQNGVDLNTAVANVNAAINQVQSLLTTAGSTVDSTVSNTVGGIIGGLGSTVGSTTGVTLPSAPTAGSAVSTLNATIDGLQNTLSGLLTNALSALDNASLLSVSGLEVGLTTKAADTVQNSAAGITAKLGTVNIGNLAIPGVDLGAAASQISALVNNVTSQLSGVLGTISPSLANLVSIKVLDQNKSVSSAGGYTKALATLTGLTATIKPPADLANVVSTITAATNGVNDLLGTLGTAVPAVQTVTATLQTALGNVAGLAGGGTVTVAQVSAESNFAPAAAGAPATPSSELPRTGQDGAPLAVLGVLLLGMSLALVRWLRRPVTTD